MNDPRPTKRSDTTRSIRMPDRLWEWAKREAEARAQAGRRASECTPSAVLLDVIEAKVDEAEANASARVAGKE